MVFGEEKRAKPIPITTSAARNRDIGKFFPIKIKVKIPAAEIPIPTEESRNGDYRSDSLPATGDRIV